MGKLWVRLLIDRSQHKGLSVHLTKTWSLSGDVNVELLLLRDRND